MVKRLNHGWTRMDIDYSYTKDEAKLRLRTSVGAA